MSTDNKKNNEELNGADESRRRFLKNAGKLAVYTPPAMITLMKPSYASFARSGGRPHDRPKIDKEKLEHWQSVWEKFLEWLRSLG